MKLFSLPLKRWFCSLAVLGALISLPVAFGACKSQSSDGKLKIALIPKATTGAFWQTVHAGGIKGAQESNVELIWVGTEKEDQRALQINIVDSQVLGKVNGIVLAPLDGEALVKPVREANQSKIPVVIIDSALMGGDEYISSFIATDNFAGGKLAAEKMGVMLGGQGKVALLRHMEGSASTGKREAGFLEGIKKFPGILVVSDEQYGGRDPQKASENLLLRFTQGGELALDGIFCSNLTTTYGMLQALRRARRSGQAKLIGFDSDDSLVKGLQQGEIHGLVIQDPFNMGFMGVQAMAKHLKGEKVPPRQDTGVTFVTAENLTQPEVQKLLYPDLKKWLNQD